MNTAYLPRYRANVAIISEENLLGNIIYNVICEDGPFVGTWVLVAKHELRRMR